MKDKFLEFYYENKNIFWVAVIIVVAVVLGYAALSDKNSEESESANLDNNILQNNITTTHDTFSLLGEYAQGYVENNHAYEYDLYLKKPLISSGDFNNAINSFIELVKYKYNTLDGKEFISGIRINVYDRLENYEAGANPRATVVYMLREEDEKKREKEDEYMEGYDLRWEHTISQTKFPDYNDYLLTINFMEYNTAKYTVYSDKEYELFRKLTMYKELKDSTNAGIVAYMVWELGLETPHIAVFNDLNYFVSYAQSYGESLGLYEGKLDDLKRRFAIENPRFLAFIEEEKIYDNKLQAKRALVKLNREYYLPIFVEEAQRIVKEVGGEEGIEALEEVTELESVGETTAIEGGYDVEGEVPVEALETDTDTESQNP